MRNCYLTILLLFSGMLPQAQEILSQPESKFITSFPFKQFSGGVMVIRARFANIADTLNFILDTGSGGISLDSSTCAEFKIPLRATDTTITGIGGIHKVSFSFDQTLHLPGLSVHHLNFHVNDYDVLSSVYGEKVDGIIGYGLFSRYIVKINFETNMIEVFSPGKFDYPSDGTMLHPVFTALPIQWMHIKDRKRTDFNFYFDTGAGLCFLMSEQYARDSNILLSRRKPVVTQAEGMGGRLQMRLTVIKEVKIGPYRFRNVPTYLYQDEYNVTSYPYVGGLVGNDLIRRFNLVLNYPGHEIHLSPNSHYAEPFDYAYTGMGIYYVQGKIMVEDVIEGSPADKGHFKVGDEIISIGTNISHNVQVYKNLLQSPNEEMKVIVNRNGKLILLSIRPISVD